MTFQNKKLGQDSENLAAKLLQNKGYKVIAQNLRTNRVEIDILAKDGESLVIVEVKSKTNQKFSSALEMITKTRQRKLILLTLELQAKYQTEKVRIDLVTVGNAGSEPIIKHHKGLVELNS